MNPTLKVALFLGSFIILIGLAIWNSVLQHEAVHQTIYQVYGIDSEIRLLPEGIFSNRLAETAPLNYTKARENCNEKCEQLHMENEIYGYNSFSIYVAIYICTMFLMMFAIMFMKGGFE